MRKNVLVIALSQGERWNLFEKVILQKGLPIVCTRSLKEALYRLENEIFSVVILEDDASGSRQKEFAEQLRLKPFGITTPMVVLGPEPTPKDRSLLVSVLDQYFPLDTDPEVLADFLDETHTLRSEKAKRGEIGSIPIPQILYQASCLRMSGAIVFERGEEKCVVYLEAGYVVFASSNRDENRFGEFLFQRKVITREQFIHAIGILQRTGKRLGRILVEEGFLKPQILQTLLQAQIKHIVFTIFDWTSGEFYTLFEENFGKDNSVARVQMAPLIIEGVQLKLNESLLNKEFEPFDSKVTLSMNFDELQKRVHLGKNEVDFLRLIGVGRSIEELLNLNSYSRLESLRLLYGFKIIGFLTFEKGVFPPARSIPTKDERMQAVDELFSPKKLPEVHHEPVAKPHKGRGWRIGYVIGSASMAVALAIFLTLVTLFNTQGSKVGETSVRKMDLQPPTPIPTVAPTPTREPEVELVEKAPEPTAKPEISEFSKLIEQAEKQKDEGRLNEALATYRRALQLKPQDLYALLQTGELLFELDRSMEALEVLEEAKKLAPSDARPYLALGTIHLMRNQKELAKKSFETYLALVEPSKENRPRITEVKRILSSIENRP